jgi:hypothetical protein
MKRFYFNTGVKYSDYPYLCEGQIERGGTKQIPFDCEDVPEGAQFKFACDDPNLYPEAGYVVRPILNNALHSKYAYFSK